MKTTLQTDISPITNNIYTDRAVPEANHWNGEKEDVTNQVIHAVALHVLRKYPDGVVTLTVADRETKEVTAYEIEVKKEKRPGGAK